MLKVSAASSGPIDFGLHRSDDTKPAQMLVPSSTNHTCGEIQTASDYWCSTLEVPSTYHHWNDGVEQLDNISTNNEGEVSNNNVFAHFDSAQNDGGMDLSGNVYDGMSSNNNVVMSAEYVKQEPSSDDMLLAPLDDLFDASSPQAFVCDSSISSVDDLFPTSQDVNLESDIWSIESLQDLETSLSPFQSKDVKPASASDPCEDEKASHMFSEWLKSNSHCISLSDLRKIKLKTSTIETATRRLGGGKKGLLLFVRFVLMWIQNCHIKQADSETVASISTTGGMKPCGFTQPMESREMCYRKSTEEQPSGITSANVKTLDHVQESWGASNTQWMMNSNPSVECNSFTYNINAYGDAQTSLPFSSAPKGWIQHNVPSVHSESSTLPIQTPLQPTIAKTDALAGHSGPQYAQSLKTTMHQPQHCSDARPAATTRAARRSRMERQRWSVRRNRKWSLTRHPLSGVDNTSAASWSQFMHPSATENFPNSNLRASGPRIYKLVVDAEQLQKADKHFRLLFHKELKQSDVGNLGRIVLPKKAAETCLPLLEMRDGMNLAVEDYESTNVWNVRYRFWPNNKSRMYLLENTGEFVKSHNLKEGDYIMLYFNLLTNRYVIRGAKCEEMQCGTDASLSASLSSNACDYSFNNTPSKAESNLSMIPNSEECGDDSILAELIEQSLDDFRDSPEVNITDGFNHV